MQNARDVLTPDALGMLQTIASAGSFAAAARELGMVPSALSYRVRQIEDALDVLLYDRSARQARLTEAGAELLREGARLLADLEAVANRVKRVATGWEAQLTIAVDSIIAKPTVMDLCARFLALQPPTRIKLRDETLSGTLEALTSGQADLAIGVAEVHLQDGLEGQLLGEVSFVYAVAPHHPLAAVAERLAHRKDWPRLYDLAAMRSCRVPVAAAVYWEDMYVDFELSQRTARRIPGLRQWVTSELMHSGIRDDGARVFEHLMGLVRGSTPLF